MNILIVVTHLLGSGHLRRAINLAQEFVTSGHSVTLASGGLPVKNFSTEGFALEQLPPLRSDGTNFTRLLDADGDVADDRYLQAREDRLREIVKSLQPEVIITELFPFGRRMLRREFIGLLEAAQSIPSVPAVLSSVRDILAAPSSEKKVLQTEALIEKYYDGVLVHSDPATTPLGVSWPVTDLIQSKLFYTGYVAQSVSEYTTNKNTAEIIVSAGGGSVGRRVYETAIEAARLSSRTSWRILVGGSDAQQEVARLQTLAASSSADSTTHIEPNRPDFRELLSRAACSVSMCGYNTAIDLLLTGTPGVLIPFDAGGEKEQTLRAASLSERAAYKLLLDKDLTAESLQQAVAQATEAGRFATDKKQFNGALETVRFATRLAEQKR